MRPFSERIGKIPKKSVIQVNSMDEDLRVGLWNVVSGHYWVLIEADFYDRPYAMDELSMLLRGLWAEFFKKPLDEFPGWEKAIAFIRRWYFDDADWTEVYDFVETVPS